MNRRTFLSTALLLPAATAVATPIFKNKKEDDEFGLDAAVHLEKGEVKKFTTLYPSWNLEYGPELIRLKNYALLITDPKWTVRLDAIKKAKFLMVQSQRAIRADAPEMQKFAVSFNPKDLPSKEIKKSLEFCYFNLRFREAADDMQSQRTVVPLIRFVPDYGQDLARYHQNHAMALLSYNLIYGAIIGLGFENTLYPFHEHQLEENDFLGLGFRDSHVISSQQHRSLTL